MNNATLIAAKGTQEAGKEALRSLSVPKASPHQPASHYQPVATIRTSTP